MLDHYITENEINNIVIQGQKIEPADDSEKTKKVASGSTEFNVPIQYQTRNVFNLKFAGLSEQDAILVKNEVTKETLASMTYSSGIFFLRNNII